MKKTVFKALCICVAMSLCLAGCSEGKSETGKTDSKENNTVSAPVPSADFSVKASKQKEVEKADAFITLKESDAEITGSGADFNGSDIVISKGGSYAVSGTIANGRIVVKAGKGEVNVILNGADITSNYSSAFLVKKAGKVTLTAYEGSVNILKDAANYDYSDDYSDADEMEPDASVYSEEDLLINGAGQIMVQGNCANGVTSKTVLDIENTNITVSATGHGITGKESLVLKNTAFNVISGRDGLRANSTDASLGTVTLSGSNGSVTSGEDGVQAETILTVESGNYSVLSGGGSTGEPDSEISTKALKGGSEVLIKNGNITTDSSDDSIHSNGKINIQGGIMTLKSGDDAVHADGDVIISGGTLSAEYCYEGLEATNVTLSGGDVNLVANDDGINISGGDGSSEEGRPGMDMFASQGGKLAVSGGNLFVNAEGDGIDANGDVEISGGVVVVNGPTKGGNGVLDYDGEFNISGGELIASGSASMSQSPSEGSLQNSLVFTDFSGKENDLFCILAADGTELITCKSPKQFGWVCYSSPKIKTGESYTAYLGGSHSGKETNGVYSDGKYTSGTKIADIKAESTVSSNGSINGGFGGFGGQDKPQREQGEGERPENFPDELPESFDGKMPENFPGQPPEGFDGEMPEGFNGEMPEGFQGQPPEGFDGEMPGGFSGKPPFGDGEMPDFEQFES